MDRERRFLYHAEAVAFGARLRRPFAEVVPAQAAAVLPPSGGHGSARVDGFQHRDLVSFRAAYSTVAGNEADTDKGRVYNTLATATVEGLNIQNVVTADAVVARLVSEEAEDGDDVPLVPVGSHFVNLRIAGTRIDLRPHELFFRSRTLAELAEESPKQKVQAVDSTDKPLRFTKPAARKPAAGGGASTFDDQRILTSIFERPSAVPAGCDVRHGWGIHVPGFGTVYFGEMQITRYSRRLTMLRIAMGSPYSADADCGAVGGNGSWHP